MVADDNPSGESLQRRASGSASRAKMPDPDGTLTQKRSAAMSAHVLLSEHKQTSRGHRQINAIDPNRTLACDGLPSSRVRPPVAVRRWSLLYR
jgi:hypothetical protein